MCEYYLLGTYGQVVGYFNSLTVYPNSKGELYGFDPIAKVSCFRKIDKMKPIKPTLRLEHEEKIKQFKAISSGERDVHAL